MLWVEIVGFSYVEVRYEVICRLDCKQVAIKQYVVVKLLVAPLLEVIHNGHLRRVILDHELGGDRGHEAAAEGQRRQVDILRVRINEVHFDFWFTMYMMIYIYKVLITKFKI